MSDKIAELVDKFRLQRHFSNNHTTIEVDGVFVRIPNGEKGESWQHIEDRGVFEVPTVDLLQSPSVVRSARSSTGRDTQAVNEKAQGLVSFLKRDRHETPFEGSVVFRLVVTTPVAYAQPLFRLFAAENEASGRYGGLPADDYYVPPGLSDEQSAVFDITGRQAKFLYGELKRQGVASEMARLVHPYRFYTRFYLTISLREIMKFLALANVPKRHINDEFWSVRDLFLQILDVWDPWSAQAFKENPYIQDFSWVADELGELKTFHPRFKELQHWSMDRQGYVSLLDWHGDEELMIRCMDDFPNPLKGFGHGSMTFHLYIPIFVFRQWVRHRYGNWTELSPDFDRIVRLGRFYIPSTFREQTGKTGHYLYRDMDESANQIVRASMEEFVAHVQKAYRILRGTGLPSEVASLILPYTFYIPVIWTVPIDSLFNFISLRTDSHAQRETREYARIVWDIFSRRFPRSADIFKRRFNFSDALYI